MLKRQSFIIISSMLNLSTKNKLMKGIEGSGTNVGNPVADVTVDQTDTFIRRFDGPLYLILH